MELCSNRGRLTVQVVQVRFPLLTEPTHTRQTVRKISRAQKAVKNSEPLQRFRNTKTIIVIC